MKISIIAAISENHVIGENNRVPWRIKEDLVRLKNLTRDQVVIVGRKTYESMVKYYRKSGRQMPGKTYLAVTHNQNYQPASTNDRAVTSLEQALEFGRNNQANEVFVIGGGQIFSQAIGIADKLYLTVVHKTISGDAYFPDYAEFNKVVSKKESQTDEYRYTFLELIKG